MKPWEKDWSQPADTGAKPWEKDWASQEAQPAAKPSLSLLSAAFPNAMGPKSDLRAGIDLALNALPGGALLSTPGMDALSLGARAAGTAGGALGYEGATGGKQGLEALADPETGLARPAREMLESMMRQRMEGGNFLGKLDLIPLGLGYAGMSMLEDPMVALGLAAKPAAAAGSAIARGGRRAAGAMDRFAGRLAEEASGVPEEALRAYGTKEGRAAIHANAGKEFEIGQDLVKRVENFDDYLPERQAVDKILEKMPGIDPKDAIEALRKSKRPTTIKPGKAAEKVADIPTGDAVNNRIDDLVGRLKLIAGENVDTGKMGKIPAKRYRNIRSSYDEEAKAAFQKDDREMIERALINARGQMAEDLRGAAKESGNPEFIAAMEDYSTKLDKLERVKKFLGQNAQSREARAEGFVANLSNANKTYQQQLVGDLEDIFDTDLMSRIKGAKAAKQLGKDGRPAILPRQFTGRSNLMQTIGGTLSLPVSSPALASRGTLPLLRKLSTARIGPEAEFYAKALRKLGVSASVIDAARSASEAYKPLNVLPFKKVAEKDNKKEPLAYGNR